MAIFWQKKFGEVGVELLWMGGIFRVWTVEYSKVYRRYLARNLESATGSLGNDRSDTLKCLAKIIVHELIQFDQTNSVRLLSCNVKHAKRQDQKSTAPPSSSYAMQQGS